MNVSLSDTCMYALFDSSCDSYIIASTFKATPPFVPLTCASLSHFFLTPYPSLSPVMARSSQNKNTAQQVVPTLTQVIQTFGSQALLLRIKLSSKTSRHNSVCVFTTAQQDKDMFLILVHIEKLKKVKHILFYRIRYFV